MKHRIQRICPINNRLRSTEYGGIAVESALIMPFFLMTILLLAFLIQTALIAMALHGALTQVVRQTAAAWLPVSYVLDEARVSTAGQLAHEWEQKLEQAGKTLQTYKNFLPSPIREWSEAAADGHLTIEESVGKLVIMEMVKPYLDQRILQSDRLQIEGLTLPDRDLALVTIRASYALPFRVPFGGDRLYLSVSASERAWVGGSPSRSAIANEEAEPFEVAFVSLEPDPAQPGKKATLTVRTVPHKQVSLSVLYKSGSSTAKHLGEAVADEQGFVSWTWHVSGRTTPGMWALQVAEPSGGRWEHTFQVKGNR